MAINVHNVDKTMRMSSVDENVVRSRLNLVAISFRSEAISNHGVVVFILKFAMSTNVGQCRQCHTQVERG